MTLDRIECLADAEQLAVLGRLHTEPEDGLGQSTIVLLGPGEPGFWAHVTASPEFADGTPDPLDRWSERVIGQICDDVGGQAVFPFGSPPRPFIGWALRSGACFVSPASLLVHATVGLFVSFRGAVVLPRLLDLPSPSANPCDTCTDKPCLSACPPKALTARGYDLRACHAYLDSEPGQACMTRGCRVRRACPLASTYPRLEAQSAYHMTEFHK